MKMVNINSGRFNFNHPAIIANLKTLSNNIVITVPYKDDMSSNGNIMPFYIYKKLFPKATQEQLAARKDTTIKLKMCIQTTIKQLGICRLQLKHNYL